MEDGDILPVDVVEEYWKWDCDLRSVVDEVYDILARLPGSKVGEILVYGFKFGKNIHYCNLWFLNKFFFLNFVFLFIIKVVRAFI